LKVAEMPPAGPQARGILGLFSGMRIHWLRPQAGAETIWTMGLSRPASPPVPMQMAGATALTALTCGRIRPPFSATVSITWGTPCPRASRVSR
jgi:hypothetical protein